jgi:hypothetical protein
MMKLQIHKRVSRGWETRIIEASPAEVKAWKEKTKSLLADRQIPDGCGCFSAFLPDMQKKTCNFHALRENEEIAGRASGTLAELAEAGCNLPEVENSGNEGY